LYLYNIYIIRYAALQHGGFTIGAAVPHADGRHRSAARRGPAGKETTMLNLAFALIPGLDAAGRGAPANHRTTTIAPSGSGEGRRSSSGP
jgi:hypothetical protein